MTTQALDRQHTQEIQEYTAKEVIAQVVKIQEIMEAVMRKGEHYGVIPGTPKPTLFKPGAEKLAFTFRLNPEYEETDSTIKRDDFISYTIRCTLYHIPSGRRVASGMGSCNSKEKKYRKQLEKSGETPHDLDNTFLKMACKRALVAAVLNATAASDIFTQDIEDLQINGQDEKAAEAPKPTEGKQQTIPTADGWRPDFKEALVKLCGSETKALEFLGTHGYEKWEQVPSREKALEIHKAKAKEKA